VIIYKFPFLFEKQLSLIFTKGSGFFLRYGNIRLIYYQSFKEILSDDIINCTTYSILKANNIYYIAFIGFCQYKA